MKTVIPFVILIFGVLVVVCYSRAILNFGAKTEIQCGHWSIYRICQILGVPMEMEHLLKDMPYQKDGHSLLDLVASLEKIGFQTEGIKCGIDELATVSVPCIAHMKNPDHFLVVSHVDSGYVHIFDGAGNRTAKKLSSFLKQWSGHLLLVHVPETGKRLPLFLPPIANDTPAAQFRHLIVDLGTVPAVGKPVSFQFPVKNLGSANLVVEEILTSCSCISTKKPEKPILPGEEDVIEFAYHVESNKGPFSHSVLVKLNDPQLPRVMLTASGWSGIEVTVEPRQIFINDVVNLQKKKVLCFVKYTGEGQDFQASLGNIRLNNIELIEQQLSPITEEFAKKLFPKMSFLAGQFDKIHALELTFLPHGEIGDTIEGDIEIKTNITGYEQFILSIHGKICDPIRTFPEILNFDAEEIPIFFFSRIDEPFDIVNITYQDSTVPWEPSKVDIANDEFEKQIIIRKKSIHNEQRNSTDHLLISIEYRYSKDKHLIELPIIW